MTAEAIKYSHAGTRQLTDTAVAGEKKIYPGVAPYISTAADIIAALQARIDNPGTADGAARQARHALTAYRAFIADHMLARRADMRSHDHYTRALPADSDHLSEFGRWMADDRYAPSTATHYLRAIRAAMHLAGHRVDIDRALQAAAQKPATPQKPRVDTSHATDADIARWYALRNHSDHSDSDITAMLANALGNSDNAYNPQLTVVRRDRQGRLVTQPGALLRRLILVRCTVRQLRSILADTPQGARLQPYIDADRRPHPIPDDQVDMFRLLLKLSNDADAPLDPIDLGRHANAIASGTRVEVLAGPFAGLRGTVARIRRDRRVVVAIPGLCALATPHIPLPLLRPL